MKNKKTLKTLLALLCLFTIATVALADSGWMGVSNFKDGRLNIWNPVPEQGEEVFWDGGMISHYELMGEEPGYPVYYVHGYGKATWYIGGEFEQSDEGYHYGGKRHGKVIQRFADGRVIETYWERGVRVDN